GIAQELQIGANVVASGAAELAVVAIDRRLESGAVSGRPPGDASTNLDNSACRLVPQNHRELARRIADRALRIGVNVGPADTIGIHPYLYFACSRIFDGLLHQAEFARCDEFGNEHEAPL